MRGADLDTELPEGLSDLPRRLLAAGVSPASVALEKDALLLGLALDHGFPGSVSDFYGTLLDDETRWSTSAALSAQMDGLPDDAGDAEVDALARGFLALLETHEAQEVPAEGALGGPEQERLVAGLLDDFTATLAPGQRRVLERVLELAGDAAGEAAGRAADRSAEVSAARDDEGEGAGAGAGADEGAGAGTGSTVR